jgi:hypothetical protein
MIQPRVGLLVLTVLASVSACHRASPVAAADSTRMVDAAIAAFTDSVAGQPGFARARIHLVWFIPDSVGACVWLEFPPPPGVIIVDGGPFAMPMTRDGSFRRRAFERGDCLRSRPRLHER